MGTPHFVSAAGAPRPRFRRAPSSRLTEPEHMVAIPQSSSNMSFRNRDTGFPVSFDGHRNTTLPHPEANLDPDACITEEDVHPMLAIARYRISFMSQRELQGQPSSPHSRHFSVSSDEGTPSAFSRLALSSLRSAELPSLSRGIDAFRSSNDGDSVVSSDGLSSRSPPGSPSHRGGASDHPKTDRSNAAGDSRRRRRRSSLVSRLLHR
ncbi:hypothetical protein VTK56DRAFT_35 [Thermocarpiscus australiensis]